MAKTSEPVKVTAEVSQDADSGEFIFKTLQTPRIETRAMDVRSARDRLARQLEDKLGKPVVIEEKIRLPPDLAERVKKFQSVMDQRERCDKEISDTMIPLVKDLLRHRLQHRQIAVLLKISKQWLSQSLKLDSTGTYRNTPR